MKAKLIKDEEGYSLFTREENSTNKKFIATTQGMYVDYKLSTKNCDEIFGVVDVEELAKNEYLDGYDNTEICRIAFKDGFNKAMELYQPTEIEVEIEIEMENYGYCEGCRKAGIWHCAHADTCGYSETRKRPNLDSEGYLILKKI